MFDMNLKGGIKLHKMTYRMLNLRRTKPFSRNTEDEARYMYLIIYFNKSCNMSAHRSATKTNEESISIISRSGNRSLEVAIALESKFPILRPIRPPKPIIVH